MKIKTDNPALVGKHVFEVAGLGAAPYKFLGVFEQSSSCHYCGTGILYNFVLKSADGKQFIVGSDCINKSGDYGLIQAYKTSPEFRALQAAKIKAKDEAVKAKIAEIFAAPENAFKLSVPVKMRNGQIKTQKEVFQFILNMCGVSGRAKYLKIIKAHVAIPVTEAEVEAIAAQHAKVTAAPIVVVPVAPVERVAITGKTYPVKEQLKAMGGIWDSFQKAWMVPASKSVEANALVGK